jgi:uncharacterized phage-associated protein
MATTAHDVAAAVLSKTGTVSTMKMQKLVYYSQAWSLAITGEALFGEDFQAWANGPVCRQLFNRHRDYFSVTSWDGDASKVDEFHDAIITLVVNKYGPLSAAELSDLTHSEGPWMQAREGLPRGAYSEAVISCESMRDFYRWIGGTKELVGDLLDA